MTHALEQIVQLSDSLPLLPLDAANLDPWPVDGLFAPDRSAVLDAQSDGVFEP
jgi:hypothetical protein